MTKRILIIDDEPLVGRLLRRALKGNVVTHVQSAEAGLERIAAESYDLVLCDLSMPQMSGMDLYENVRSTSGEMADRIVFMTGGAFTTEAVRFIERVPNETLDKPFDLARVRALVNETTVAKGNLTAVTRENLTEVDQNTKTVAKLEESTRPRARPLVTGQNVKRFTTAV